MNTRLYELLRNYLDCPSAETLNNAVNFHPTELDFSDELLSTFSSGERWAIYALMFAFCWQEPSRLFLERRILVEEDMRLGSYLKSRLNRSVGRGRVQEPIDYKERTPEFVRTLREAVLRHVNNPNDRSASQIISDLNPTDRDFDDTLFSALDVKGRREVYSMLLLWCGYWFQKKILEGRVKVETDPACQISISVMLRAQR